MQPTIIVAHTQLGELTGTRRHQLIELALHRILVALGMLVCHSVGVFFCLLPHWHVRGEINQHSGSAAIFLDIYFVGMSVLMHIKEKYKEVYSCAVEISEVWRAD